MLRGFHATRMGICKVENGSFWRGGEGFTKMNVPPSPVLFPALRKSEPRDWPSASQAGRLMFELCVSEAMQ